MKKTFSKLFSMVLALTFALCCFGITASAVEPEATPDAPAVSATEPAPENFYVETNMMTGIITVNWESTIARGRDTTVAIYENDSATASFQNVFTYGTYSTEYSFDVSATSKIRIDLSYKLNEERVSSIASKTIDMSVANAVKIECDDVTSDAQAEISYSLNNAPEEGFKAFLNSNGTEQELQLKGENSLSVSLVENENQVSVRWLYDEYTVFVVGKKIVSDRSTPTLEIPGVNGIVKANESTYTIAGVVEPGCTVTVNGAAITPDEDGIFNAEVSLVVGENAFEVIATGKNGISTKETVVVEWIEAGVISSNILIQFIPLAVALVVSVAIFIFVLKERKKYRKLKEDKTLRFARFGVLKDLCVLIAVLSALVTVYSVVMLVMTCIDVASVGFADAAIADVLEAYALIQKRSLFIILMVVFVIVTALAIVLRVVLLPKLEKKKVNEKPKKVKAPKKPKAPKTPEKQNFMEAPQVAPVVQNNDVAPNGQNEAPQNQENPAVEECFCGYCGTPNKTTTNFCKKCGKPIKK